MRLSKFILGALLFCGVAGAQVNTTLPPTGGSGSVTGGTCSAGFTTAVGSDGKPTCRTLTSSDVPNNAANTSGTASNITGTLPYNSLLTDQKLNNMLSRGVLQMNNTQPGLWVASQLNSTNSAYTSTLPVTLSAWSENQVYCWTLENGGAGGSEAVAQNITNDLIIRAAISSSANSGALNVVIPATFNGQYEARLSRFTDKLCTDPIPFANRSATATTATLRNSVRVPIPPTVTAAVTGAAEGGLTAGTYYYQATCIDYWESGPSSTVSATTSGTALAINLNLTPTTTVTDAVGNTTCTGINIYRSSSGTAGTFTLIDTVLPARTGNRRYKDIGGQASMSAVPPAASYNIYNAHRANSSNKGTGATNYDATQVSATSTYNFFTTDTVFDPVLQLTDAPKRAAVCAIGDSRLSQADYGPYDIYLNTAADLFDGVSWFIRGLKANGIPGQNLGMPQARLDWYLQNYGKPQFRHAQTKYCGKIVAAWAINDINNGVAPATVESNLMLDASYYWYNHIPYITATMEPVTTDTVDNFTSIANQTPINYTANRVAVNDWERAGGCVSGEVVNPQTGAITYGTPVAPTQAGNTFTCPTGSAPTALFAKNAAGNPLFFDRAASVECASNGTNTNVDGGYWCPNPGTPITGALQAATSVTLFQLASGTYTANQYGGYAIKMTSGAANGQIASIFKNDTSGNVTAFADGVSYPGGGGVSRGFTTAPAAGDTYQLVRIPTTDGLHPSVTNHMLTMTPAFSSFITANGI